MYFFPTISIYHVKWHYLLHGPTDWQLYMHYFGKSKFVYLRKYLDVKLNLFTDDDSGTVECSEYRMIILSTMYIYVLIYLFIIKLRFPPNKSIN